MALTHSTPVRNAGANAKQLSASAQASYAVMQVSHFASQLRGADYAVMAYTVNDVARAQTLFSWGVDAIFTDIPGEMLAAFAELS